MKVVRSSALAPAVFILRNIPVLIFRGWVWCPGKNPQWTGIDPGILRLAAQCLNHYATPSPTSLVKFLFIISDLLLLLYFAVHNTACCLQTNTPYNLQFLSLNCFTMYWMCKHISEAVHRTLPVAQGENSTIFLNTNSSVILYVSFIITAKKNLHVHNKNLFYSRGCRFNHSQQHSTFRPCTSRTERKPRMM
jgi:hypothetical protein